MYPSVHLNELNITMWFNTSNYASFVLSLSRDEVINEKLQVTSRRKNGSKENMFKKQKN